MPKPLKRRGLTRCGKSSFFAKRIIGKLAAFGGVSMMANSSNAQVVSKLTYLLTSSAALSRVAASQGQQRRREGLAGPDRPPLTELNLVPHQK